MAGSGGPNRLGYGTAGKWTEGRPAVLLGTSTVLIIAGITFQSLNPGIMMFVKFIGVAGTLFSVLDMTRNGFALPTEFYLYCAFNVWSVSGILIAADTVWFYDFLIRDSMTLCLALIVCRAVISRRSHRIITIPVMIIGVVLLLVSTGGASYLSYLKPDAARGLGTGGVENNPNGLAKYLLTSFMLAMFFWRGSLGPAGIRRRLLVVILNALLFLSIIASASRKTYIAVLLFLALWVWYCQRGRLRKRLGTTILLLAMAASAYFVTNFAMKTTLLGRRMRTAESQEHVDDIRYELYRTGLNIIGNHPLLGIGLGNYHASTGSDPHSDYLELAATTGIPGLLLYLLLYVVFWRRLSRLGRHVKDERLLYDIGLSKAVIITYLVLGVGQPNYANPMVMAVFFAMAAHFWLIERSLTSRPSRVPLEIRHAYGRF